MRAKPEYRNRDDTEVAVLDALVERANGGMTVFELRSSVDAPIDDIEDALGALKADDLIDATEDDGRTKFRAVDRAIPDPEDDHREDSLFDALKRKLGL
jgi:hypothetical protein